MFLFLVLVETFDYFYLNVKMMLMSSLSFFSFHLFIF